MKICLALILYFTSFIERKKLIKFFGHIKFQTIPCCCLSTLVKLTYLTDNPLL